MKKAQYIDKIMDIEWQMFTSVNNAGGKAACQMDPNTFKIMRTSQYRAWSTPVLASYLGDLEQASAQGRNLMTEKYARMMKTTFPQEYDRVAASLPPVDPGTNSMVDEIVTIHLRWKNEMVNQYPCLSGLGRPVYTRDDRPGLASFETYFRSELQTYSPDTIALYYAEVRERDAQGRSEARENLQNQVEQYGFATLDEAEAFYATQE